MSFLDCTGALIPNIAQPWKDVGGKAAGGGAGGAGTGTPAGGAGGAEGGGGGKEKSCNSKNGCV